MNVTQIVTAHLEKIKADGLFNERAECGCSRDALFPASENCGHECIPARFVKCKGCKLDPKLDDCDGTSGCFQPMKEAAKKGKK